MRFIVFTAIFIFFFNCCNSEHKRASVNYKNGQMTVEGDTALIRELMQPDTVSEKLLLTARGSEPGWYAEFYTRRIFLVSNYGKDTFDRKGIDFKGINGEQGFELDKKQETNTMPALDYHLRIKVKAETCRESGSGEERNRSIELQLNEQILKGCAYTTK